MHYSVTVLHFKHKQYTNSTSTTMIVYFTLNKNDNIFSPRKMWVDFLVLNEFSGNLSINMFDEFSGNLSINILFIYLFVLAIHVLTMTIHN